MTGHRSRVGTMAWNGYVLSTGSRDHSILHRDVRQQAHYMSKLTGHQQEVCGLRWSYDEQQLASGGNDNKVSPAPPRTHPAGSGRGGAPRRRPRPGRALRLWREARGVLRLRGGRGA
ncbi:unnamed protein product, partial [Prorocentrum cordatum]